MSVTVLTTDYGFVTLDQDQFATDADGELYVGTSLLRKDVVAVFAKGTWVYASKVAQYLEFE